jgi:hypothetical protein
MSSHNNRSEDPSDQPRRRPRRRLWTRWVFAAGGVLAAVVAAGAYWRLPLAGAVLRAALDRAGLAGATLTVDALSTSRIRLSDVRLGPELAIANAEVSFDLSRLPGNPFTRFALEGIRSDLTGADRTLRELSGNGRDDAPPTTIRTLLRRAAEFPAIAVRDMSLRYAPTGAVVTIAGSADAGPEGTGAYAARFTLRVSGEINGEKRDVALDGTAGVSTEVAIAEVRAKTDDGSVDGMATARVDLAADHAAIEATVRLKMREAGILASLSPWLQGAAGRIELAARTPAPVAIGLDTPLDPPALTAALQRAGAGGVRLEAKIEDVSLGAGQQGISGTTVQGLSGHIRLDRLVPPRTPPGQAMRVKHIAAGVTFDDLALRFALVGGVTPEIPALRIESFQAMFAGGRLSIAPTTVDSAAESNDATIAVKDVDLAAVLAAAGLEGVSGTGRLNGAIPVTVVKNVVGITGGRLEAAGPGLLRIRSDAAKQTLAQGGEDVALMLSALENFRYETLTVDIEKKLTGEGRILLATRGHNPDVRDGHPFVINLNLTGNIDRLAVVAAQVFQLPGALIRTMLPR